MLRPNTPLEGYPKPGTPEQRVGHAMRVAGANAGITFTGLTDRTPNTELFHACMLALEESPRRQTAFQEKAFEAYFTLGVFPDEAGLLACAQKVDVDERSGDGDDDEHAEGESSSSSSVEAALAALFTDADRIAALRRRAKQEALEIRMSGVSSVPFFFFEWRPVFSGARDVQDFVGALRAFARAPPVESCSSSNQPAAPPAAAAAS
mmetsp:Transcript_7508/g.31058  ORF Transcript_7508/g.31058 Transcript_7508/m.31058 type:complete len:207 (+) Transcript_7508:207-827(+)